MRVARWAAVGVGAALLFGAVIGATPADASRAVRRYVSVDPSPEPVQQGRAIIVKGRTYTARANENNKRIVRFYFANRGSGTYRYMGAVWSTPFGYYSRSFPAVTSGTWKAYVEPTNVFTAASATAFVWVWRYTDVLAAYSGAGYWQGPRISIPTAAYNVTWRYACVSTVAPFWSLAWNGANSGYEYLWRDPLTGSGTFYGRRGARPGYFDVGTQSDCRWSFTVHSGRHRVYV